MLRSDHYVLLPLDLMSNSVTVTCGSSIQHIVQPGKQCLIIEVSNIEVNLVTTLHPKYKVPTLFVLEAHPLYELHSRFHLNTS